MILIVLVVGCVPAEVPEAPSDDPSQTPALAEPFESLSHPEGETDAGDTAPVEIPPRWTRLELDDAPLPADGPDLVGGGLVVADLTGDGLLDILLPGPVDSRFYVQTAPRVFEDRAATALAGIDLLDASAASAADIDGDEDLDVIVVRYRRPVVMLRNDGGVFTDVTIPAGLVTPSWPGTGSAWGDLERDGDLDLFLARYQVSRSPGGDPLLLDTNQLYLNHGDGTFVEATDRLPEAARNGATFTGGWHDLDDDGWLDLMICNDYGQTKHSELAWNRRGTLELDNGSSGLRIRMDCMGMAVGDLNGDTVEDFVYSSLRTTIVQESIGGAWFQTAATRGIAADLAVKNQSVGWGTEIADLDVDGDDDLIIGYGNWASFDGVLTQHDALFMQQPDGHFVDMGPAEGMDDSGITRGLIVADVDRDGCPDVVRRQIGSSSPVDFGGCVGSWLAVELRAEAPNTRAVGASVSVHGPERSWHRTIQSGSTSLFSGGPPEALFGLGEVETVDVEVWWPDGRIEIRANVAARQRLLLTQGPR